MHLAENGLLGFQTQGTAFIYWLPRVFKKTFVQHNAARATNMNPFEMNGFMSWLIHKIPFDIIIKANHYCLKYRLMCFKSSLVACCCIRLVSYCIQWITLQWSQTQHHITQCLLQDLHYENDIVRTFIALHFEL